MNDKELKQWIVIDEMVKHAKIKKGEWNQDAKSRVSRKKADNVRPFVASHPLQRAKFQVLQFQSILGFQHASEFAFAHLGDRSATQIKRGF